MFEDYVVTENERKDRHVFIASTSIVLFEAINFVICYELDADVFISDSFANVKY